MQDITRWGPAAALGGKADNLFVQRSEVTNLARLLKDAGTTLGADPGIAGDILTRAAVMVASMLRAERGPAEPGAGATTLAPWQVNRVRSCVDEQLHGRLPVPYLATTVRLSGSYFSRAFRLTFGCSPHAYVITRRVERAKALIRDTDQPLAHVALACGLSDQAHLSRIFRRHVGCTPSMWRRNARQ